MYIKIKNMFSYIQLVNSFNIISTTSLTVISFEIIFHYQIATNLFHSTNASYLVQYNLYLYSTAIQCDLQ